MWIVTVHRVDNGLARVAHLRRYFDSHDAAIAHQKGINNKPFCPLFAFVKAAQVEKEAAQ